MSKEGDLPSLDLLLAVFDTIREPGREYSQAEIARACGCSRQTISQIERRALEKLRRAAKRRAAGVVGCGGYVSFHSHP